MNIPELTAFEIAEKIKSKQIHALKVTEAYLSQIENREPSIDAFISVLPDYALTRAKEIDAQINAGEDPGPLAGVPIAVKDNICTNFAKTTCGSKILKNYNPPYNAHVTEKLLAVGAVIIGKTNLDEFAMGSSTENSGIKTTKNPWNTECVPGGSSGGSAAAVSAGMAPLSLGSETGGSIRLPAAFCGVCGLKPTYGRVSRYGLVAFGSSLDQIGPFGRDARDIAMLMNVLADYDSRDSTSVPESLAPKVDYLTEIQAPMENLKIGMVKQYSENDGVDSEIQQAVKDAISTFEKLGAEIIEITLPHTDYAIACYYLIATAEASSNLSRYDGVHYGHRTENPKDYVDVYSSSRAEGFGDEVKRRIMLGTYALSSGYYDAYYLKAQKVRTLIRQDFDKAFENVDIIASPVSPTTAFRIGEKSQDPLTMYLSDIFTISANLAGIPGIAIPCGFSKNNMPIGLQIMGKHFDEKTIIRAAWNYQQNTDWHKQRPKGI